MSAIKLFAWFLFKSPQRKWVGWSTLLTDFVAWLQRLFGLPSKGTISICVGNFNRSKAMLEFLLESVSSLKSTEYIELSVFDCGSSDIENLESEIRKKWKGRLVFTKEKIAFSRAVSFNRAINQSSGDYVLVCDADMSLPENMVEHVFKKMRKNSAIFPVCQWQINSGSRSWRWFTEGTGIFAASKKQLEKTGLLDEKYTSWGKEDWDLFFRFYKAGIAPVRCRWRGLYHHWHEPTKPADFIKMF